MVLFLKSDKEFDKQYQYGIVKDNYESRDGHVRKVKVECHNYNEKTKRTTQRGVRELVIILPNGERGVEVELGKLLGSVIAQIKPSSIDHAFFVYYENADLVYDVIRMRQLSNQILHELSPNDSS